MSRAQKLEYIKQTFLKLFCFTSDEINAYMQNIEFFPDEGLDAVINSLRTGFELQNEFLEKNIEKDKDYVKNLDQFLRATTTNIKNKFEKSESQSAESLISDL